MSKANIVWGCVIAAVAGACAIGGTDSGSGTDAAVSRQDASGSVSSDAARSDAGTSADAQVSQLPDAGTGSGSGSGSGSGGGLFCTLNSDCTVAGECCVTLGGPSGFCAPGSVVLGQCFPD